jgi:plastocyanin
MMRVSASVASLAIAAIVLGACASVQPTLSPTATPTAPPVATATPMAPTSVPTPAPPTASEPAEQEPAVSIIDFGFQPDALTVAAGTTVSWTNTGATGHTVTFDDGPDSGAIADGGGTYERTFDAAGTYDYHCSIHPSMRGSVTVE